MTALLSKFTPVAVMTPASRLTAGRALIAFSTSTPESIWISVVADEPTPQPAARIPRTLLAAGVEGPPVGGEGLIVRGGRLTLPGCPPREVWFKRADLLDFLAAVETRFPIWDVLSTGLDTLLRSDS